MTHVEICRWDALSEDERQHLMTDLDHIFFTSSMTQSFESDAAKSAFRDRWFGRYFRHFPHLVWVARRGDGQGAVGYVLGSLDDPARDPLFSDLPFLARFAEASARYPAHLHVNLDAEWRVHGIGRRLVEAFSGAARDAGAPGVHVVTQRGMRNVRFYLANGFLERAAAKVGESELVLLGRDLVERV